MSDKEKSQMNERDSTIVWYECPDCRIKFSYPRYVHVEYCMECGSTDVKETEEPNPSPTPTVQANEKEEIWEIIKPHMWRVAHFDADQQADYQRELEDLFEAAREFERKRGSR